MSDIEINDNKLLVLSGNDAGKEVMNQALQIIDFLNDEGITNIELDIEDVGIDLFYRNKEVINKDTLYKINNYKQILMGKFGGNAWNEIGVHPSEFINAVFMQFYAFASLYHIKSIKGLESKSLLKNKCLENLDFFMVRELSGGLYHGKPRGFAKTNDGFDIAYNSTSYKSNDIYRIIKFLMFYAKKLDKNITSFEKSAENFEVYNFWRNFITYISEKENPDSININCINFDGILNTIFSENKKELGFLVSPNEIANDSLSNLNSLLGNSVYDSMMLATMRDVDDYAFIYSPANVGILPNEITIGDTNPIPMISSVANMLRFSFGKQKEADLLLEAIDNVIETGIITQDIADDGHDKEKIVTTSIMGEEILSEYARLIRKNKIGE